MYYLYINRTLNYRLEGIWFLSLSAGPARGNTPEGYREAETLRISDRLSKVGYFS